MCEILSCDCQNDKNGNPAGAKFQDATYGKGKRAHNRTVKGIRCTVCGRETVNPTLALKKSGATKK